MTTATEKNLGTAGRGDLSEEIVLKRRKAAGDPVRQRVLDQFYDGQERTAKELSAALGLGVNGLYYHLRILEDAQLIVLGSGRASTSGMEKTYVLAEDLRCDWQYDEEMVRMYSAMLEGVKYDMTEAVYEAAQAVAHEPAIDPAPAAHVRNHFFTTSRQEIHELYQGIEALIGEFRERANTLSNENESDLRRAKVTYALRERLVQDTAER